MYHTLYGLSWSNLSGFPSDYCACHQGGTPSCLRWGRHVSVFLAVSPGLFTFLRRLAAFIKELLTCSYGELVLLLPHPSLAFGYFLAPHLYILYTKNIAIREAPLLAIRWDRHLCFWGLKPGALYLPALALWPLSRVVDIHSCPSLTPPTIRPLVFLPHPYILLHYIIYYLYYIIILLTLCNFGALPMCLRESTYHFVIHGGSLVFTRFTTVSVIVLF